MDPLQGEPEMSLSIFIMLASFLWLLFSYQKQSRIYIGYTTVLCLLFGGVFICGLLGPIFFDEWSSHDLLTLLVWILGGVVIYLTSQLTLAFEKIRHLSQRSGLADVARDRLEPLPHSEKGHPQKED
jgi:hypothetical protein